MKRLFILTLACALFYATASPALTQEQPTQKPTEEELAKEKAEREKNAYRLLDQVIDEAQSLRLTENRVRVQINAADALWDKNQGRARSLFTMAADGLAELTRNPQTSGNRPNSGQNQDRRAFQLRQELVLAAAKHDAQLAYQLLAATKPAAPVAQTTNPVGPRQPMVDPEDNLEQMLLGRIAALDPKLAAQNAEQMMEKGQFPRSLTEVIARLSHQDPEAGAKLADKTVKKIQASNILTNNEAVMLAQQMLNSGIRQPAADTAAVNPLPAGVPLPRGPVLEQSAYVDLLSTVIDAALKVSLPSQNPQQRPATAAAGAPQRGRIQLPNTQSPIVVNRPGGPTPEQTEQMNARRLLAAMMIAMPVIEQQLPSKAQAVRQKLSELGIGNLGNLGQPVPSPSGAPTTDALVQAAINAPPQMQTRLYQQAAFRALEEGNTDRARQIATDHLPASTRESVLQRIEFRELVKKADSARFEEIRQAVNRLQTDNEKLELLLQLAVDAQKTDQKLAGQLLDEARQLTNRRATNYDHFNQQLRVAHAFIAVDPARSFEVLEPAISHLNELLSAAAILNGFEISMFRDGEMTMQGGSGLTSTITRLGQELATLARTDFERADTLAGRFQMTEPRIMTRLLIVQGLLNPPRTDQRSGIVPVNVGRVSENVNIARP
jgi:hypothetical protein